MVTLARHALIVLAVMLSPAYALWIFGGWCADHAGQRRYAMLKGPFGIARKRLNK